MFTVDWEMVRTINVIHYYVEIIIASLAFPFALLSIYVVVTQTPKQLKCFRDLVFCMIITRIALTSGLSMIQPRQLPYVFGGFNQGPIGYLVNDKLGFFAGLMFCTAHVLVDGVLSIMGFYVHASGFKLRKPMIILWMNEGHHSKYVFALIFVISYVVAVLDVSGVMMEPEVFPKGDVILDNLRLTSAGVVVVAASKWRIAMHLGFVGCFVVTALFTTAYVALQSGIEIRLNESVVLKKTYDTQKELHKFLVSIFLYNIFFFYVPLTIVCFGFFSPVLSYVVVPIAQSVLTAYGIIHSLIVLMHIKYYRSWVLKNIFRRKDIKIQRYTSTTDEEHKTTTDSHI